MKRCTLILAALLSLSVNAQEAPAPAGAEAAAAKFLETLKPQSGQIALPGGLAALNLGEQLRYLTPADAKRLLEEGWGNPPGTGEGTLGMILPATGNPLAADAWGVVITYSDDGHVSDDDAGAIDYAQILKQMQESTKENNEQRTKQGYAPITLTGWAETPRYDAATHKIYWAKDLAFGNASEHTLNYCIRVLGRQGVLELNAIAAVSQLQQIRESMKQVVASADFTTGNRYGDFNSGTDKLATYGLAALVAGGVAAKTGLFAKLFTLLLAAKKLVVLALAGLAAFFGKLFKRKPADANPG